MALGGSLSNRIIASRLGPNSPRGVTWKGAGGWVMLLRTGRVCFGVQVVPT